MLRMSSVTLHVLLANYSSIVKTQDSFVNRTCGKLSCIFPSATFNSETVSGFGKGFTIIFVLGSPHMISPCHSNLETGELLLLFTHLRAVLMETLLRDACNARRTASI